MQGRAFGSGEKLCMHDARVGAEVLESTCMFVCNHMLEGIAFACSIQAFTYSSFAVLDHGRS